MAEPESPVPETFIVKVPLFGAGTAAQEGLVPSVVRYLPVWLVWAGSSALIAAPAVVWPVPPLPIGRVPDTWVVSPILPYKGAVPTPPEISALPVATSANLAREVVPSANRMSPIV